MVSAGESLAWTYKEFTFVDWQPQRKWAYLATRNRLQDYYAAAAVRSSLWQECHEPVLQELQSWLDDGWEPVGTVGPEAIELDKTETVLRGFGLEDLLLWIITLGLGFIIQLALGPPERRYICYTPKILVINMRHPFEPMVDGWETGCGQIVRT